jgi:mono/diheme cytochrome c family protein
LRADQIAEIEAAGRLNQNAFNALKAWGDAQGFEFDPPPGMPFEQVQERSPAYLANLEAVHPGYLEQGAEVVGPDGVNCYACHIRDGKTPGGDPLSWGPDLAYAKDRLRPDWIRKWVYDAQQIYPGTKMPTAIDLLRDPKLDAIMEASADERLEAVKDFLMNSDRIRQAPTPQTGQ